MPGKFWLLKTTIGRQSPVEISEGRYQALSSAKASLNDALTFEQKYDLVLGNYLAFETWAASYSMRVAVEFDHSYVAALRTMSEANRQVMNLLSSTRTYIDQVKQDFSHLQSLSPTFSESAKALFSAAYDDCFEYRFLEALRNHVQHRALPVHRICPADREASGPWSEAVAFACRRDFLEEDSNFKKSVLAELPEQINLRYAVREYVASLSRIHIKLRRFVAAEIDAARDLLTAAIAEFAEVNPEGCVGLCACREVGDGIGDVVPLLLDWDDARLELVRLHRHAAQIDRQ